MANSASHPSGWITKVEIAGWALPVPVPGYWVTAWAVFAGLAVT